MTYRVREYTRDLHGMDGKVNFLNYYVYCSDEFEDYKSALKCAIQYEKRTNIPVWVDCMDTYEYFDQEDGKPFGWV